MARYSPARDRFKIYIIDEVHMLSGAAFNALLKTLEEPPPHVKFIFATTESHKIPATILSRCQRYDFKMIATRELARHLRSVADQERIQVSDQALALVARAAEGSVRDALSLFDQVLAFTGDAVKDEEVAGLLGLVDRELLRRATRAIVDGSSLAMLELVESLADYGADYRNFVRELLLHLREVLLVKLAPPGSPLLSQILPEEVQELQAVADALSEEDLLRGLDLLTRAEGELRNVTDPRVALDLVLLKLVQLRRLVPFVEVVARVERFLGGAAPAPSGAVASPRALPEPRRSAAPAPARDVAAVPLPARPLAAEGPAAQAEPRAVPPAGSASAVLAAMLDQCQGRPSLAAPLRAATARKDRDTLVLELPPDFLTFAKEHTEDYQALARKAAGQGAHAPDRGRVGAGGARVGGALARDSEAAEAARGSGEGARRAGGARPLRRAGGGRQGDSAREGGRVNPFGDPRKMMKQLQQAQERLQAEIAQIQVEVSAGGGVVKVEMDGQKQVKSLKIDPEVVNRDDVEMLQDLVLSAVNEASRKVEASIQEKVGGLTGGMKLPGM